MTALFVSIPERGSSTLTRPASRKLIGFAVLSVLLGSHGSIALAQLPSVAQASLSHVPYWWRVRHDDGVDAVPIVWINDVDGGGSAGCCAVGAAGRLRSETATVWFGLAFGSSPDAGAPAAIEAAVEINGGTIAFRSLHGRSGFAGRYPVWQRNAPGHDQLEQISLGLSALWLDDERYLETVPLFDCPADAPSAPCAEVETPYPWSEGSDQAIAAEALWGGGDWLQPRISTNLVVGLEVVGGERNYFRWETDLHVTDSLGVSQLDTRLSAGWASGNAPLQRRFLLEGADPVSRWLNPYLDGRGALLGDLPYYMPDGPRLRSYTATRPLVKRYIAASAELSRWWETRLGFAYAVTGFLAAAWTPAIPDRLGPEALNPDGAVLFDWRELPAGEDEALGRFRARSLEKSEIWADAGLAVSGSYDRVRVTVSVPVWASAADFASQPIGGGEKKAFALRWTLSIAFIAAN